MFLETTRLLKCNIKDQFDTKSEVTLLLNYDAQELIAIFNTCSE